MDHDTRFYKFVEYVDVNSRKVLIGVLFLCLLGALYTAFESRETIVDVLVKQSESQIVSDEQFRMVVKLNSLIETRLDGLRTRTGASRVVVRRFHNGRQDLTTVPFEKVSDVYSSQSEDFDLLIDTDRTLPLSKITYSLRQMWGDNASEPVCYSNNVEDHPAGELKRFYQQHELKYIQVCPIVNIARYPIGLVEVAFRFDPNEEERAVIEDRTEKAAGSIGGYLEMMADVKNGD